MTMPDRYPGTPAHEALLAAVVAHYRDDPRVLAVGLFGSLVRGTWDQYSDLDLDIVVRDGVEVDVAAELRRLCAAFTPLGERAALIVVQHADRGDVVLSSLHELSVRYHPLRATSPNIVDSLLVLSGSLDAATICAAGEANRAPPDTSPPALQTMLDACLRYAVEADAALPRGRLWSAHDLLERMRDLLFELYAATQGTARPLRAFQAQADAALQARLAATVAPLDADAQRQALDRMLDLLATDLDALTAGQIQLGPAQREVLRAIGARR
jgi:predicted nucleotidyltransferase